MRLFRKYQRTVGILPICVRQCLFFYRIVIDLYIFPVKYSRYYGVTLLLYTRNRPGSRPQPNPALFPEPDPGCEQTGILFDRNPGPGPGHIWAGYSRVYLCFCKLLIINNSLKILPNYLSNSTGYNGKMIYLLTVQKVYIFIKKNRGIIKGLVFMHSRA